MLENKGIIKCQIPSILLILIINSLILKIQATSKDGTFETKDQKFRFNGPNLFSHSSGYPRVGRLISFGATDETKILVKYTLPVLTIPTENTGDSALFFPQIRVNVRNFVIFGLLAIFSNILYPLFTNQNNNSELDPELVPPPEEIYNHPPPHWHHGEDKREDKGETKSEEKGEIKSEIKGEKKKSSRSFTFDILNWKNSLNKILFRDNTVTPCVQRVVCSAVAESKNTKKPTNLNKIVDVMTSTIMFDQAANDTIIQDAVTKGRESAGPDECTSTYKECSVQQQDITNMLKLVGI